MSSTDDIKNLFMNNETLIECLRNDFELCVYEELLMELKKMRDVYDLVNNDTFVDQCNKMKEETDRDFISETFTKVNEDFMGKIIRIRTKSIRTKEFDTILHLPNYDTIIINHE